MLVAGAVAVLVALAVVGLPGARDVPGPAPTSLPPSAGQAQRLASLLECLAEAGVTGLSSADAPSVVVAEVTRQQPGDSAGRRCLDAHEDVVGGR